MIFVVSIREEAIKYVTELISVNNIEEIKEVLLEEVINNIITFILFYYK